ncbi:MAG: 50S ribosomal protein L35 [Candidatus Hydrogenedentes bacterium]|nr:50S ribosomal protein L35 [Candidatus Hydrogenedentota bacterium]
MPKLKTNRAAAKRFKRTKSGILRRFKEGARHLMNSKSSKQRRSLRKATAVSDSEKKRIKAMLPYS